jgi:hypothetical protein
MKSAGRISPWALAAIVGIAVLARGLVLWLASGNLDIDTDAYRAIAIGLRTT